VTKLILFTATDIL